MHQKYLQEDCELKKFYPSQEEEFHLVTTCFAIIWINPYLQESIVGVDKCGIVLCDVFQVIFFEDVKKYVEVRLMQLLHVDIPLGHATMPDSHFPCGFIFPLNVHFISHQQLLAEKTVVFEQKAKFILNNVTNT